MRNFLIILLLAVQATATIEAQEFDYPISQTKYIVSNAQLDNSGKSCIWDLQDAEFQQSHLLKIRLCSYDSSIVIKEEYNTQNIYEQTNDQLFFAGLENKLTKITYKKKELYVSNNLEYGDTLSGTFEGQGLFSDKIPLAIHGTYQTVVDGTGTLILPYNKTIENVLRLTTDRKIDNNGKLINVRERRWITSDFAFPILEETEVSSNKTILGKYIYYTSTSTSSETKNKSKLLAPNKNQTGSARMTSRFKTSKSDFHFSVNQKQSKDYNSISFDIPQNNSKLSYAIFTIDGINVYSSDINLYQKGHHTVAIPKLVSSNYIICFTVNDKQYSKKIQL